MAVNAAQLMHVLETKIPSDADDLIVMRWRIYFNMPPHWEPSSDSGIFTSDLKTNTTCKWMYVL